MVRTWLLAHSGDHLLSEELEQETALAAWRDYRRYDPERPFDSWVLGIARNVLRLHWRRRSTRPRPLSLEDCPELTAAAQRQSDHLFQQQAYVRACLEELEAQHRDLLKRYYTEQQDTAQIAKLLCMSLSAVKTRLHRLRQWIRRCIEQRARSDGEGS